MPQTTAEPRGSHEPIFRSSAAEHAPATPNAERLQAAAHRAIVELRGSRERTSPYSVAGHVPAIPSAARFWAAAGRMTVDRLGSHALTSQSFAGERARAIPNAATLSGHGRRETGRWQRLPARGPSGGLSLARPLGRLRPIRALGQAAEAAGHQLDRVAPAAVPLVAALPQAPAHMDQVALRDVLRDVGPGGGAEPRALVPVRVIPPLATLVFEPVVGGDRHPHRLAEGLDGADPADDREFCDVLHGSLHRWGCAPLRWRSVMGGTGEACTREGSSVAREPKGRAFLQRSGREEPRRGGEKSSALGLGGGPADIGKPPCKPARGAPGDGLVN